MFVHSPPPIAGVLLAVLCVALAFIPVVGPVAEVAVALGVAGLALLGGWCGLRVAAVCSAAWLIGRWCTSAEHTGIAFASIALQASVALALAWWIAGLRTRWQAEHRRARLDALTGVPNRQAFYERCTAELSRAGRFRRPLTLAVWDGDGFKAVNDQRGHAAGDRALQVTAQTLSRQIRQYDFVARLGGDEFVTLFPETGPEAAVPAVQRIRQALLTDLEPQFAPLTYGVGVVTFLPGNWDVEACLRETDRVLYEAKRSGRGETRYETLPR